MNIIIEGRIPSKKNQKQIVCRGKFPQVLPSKAYKEWNITASEQLKGVKFPPDMRYKLPLSKAVIVITLYAPDLRKGDLTNKAESLMDLLVDNKILSDDDWFTCGDIRLLFGGVDRERPRAEISIT